MQKLVVASGNLGKIKEIAEILKGKYEVVSMKDAGFDGDVEEDGETFFENALKKAKTVSSALNCSALADDSGLTVDALGGAPGVYSARYGGKHGDDLKNRKKLLKNLKGETDRKAQFKTCVVLYNPNGEYITGYGETTGVIGEEEVGENGFGYDSVFISDDLGKTFAEATDEEKNSVSHRFRALSDLIKKL